MDNSKAELIELMNNYGDYLKQTAFFIMHDLQLAEDMTQETFISYYQKKQFKGKSSSKTYLYRILMNHIKMHFRKHKNDIVVDASKYESNESVNFEELIINKMDLSYALKYLNSKYKDTLILYYYNDLSIEELSAIMGCSKSSTKMRLKRGREKLRVIIGGTFNEENNN